MGIEQEFLNDICEHVKDDAPRLIYADWLDDADQPELAEFIRLSIEFDTEFPNGIQFGVYEYADDMKRRLRSLMKGEWVVPLAGAFEVNIYPTKVNPDGRVIFHNFGTDSITVKFERKEVHNDLFWNRGFVSGVATTAGIWEKYGPAVVRATPIESVDIRGKKPNRLNQDDDRPSSLSNWFYWRWGGDIAVCSVETKIWHLMADYDPKCRKYQGMALYETETEALKGLSDALIKEAWSRK